jgi:hypothetical protein
MMKQHSRSTALLAGILSAAILMPTMAFAQTGGTATSGRALQNFCTQIDKVLEKVSEGMNEREGRHVEKREDRKGKLDERFLARDEKRTLHRDAWDTKRDEWTTKLNDRASSTEQKAAVVKFVADIKEEQ